MLFYPSHNSGCNIVSSAIMKLESTSFPEEQLFDSKMFFRVNRNFLINFSAIHDIIVYSSNRLKIVLTNWTEKDEILVSRERVSDFKNWMDRWAIFILTSMTNA